MVKRGLIFAAVLSCVVAGKAQAGGNFVDGNSLSEWCASWHWPLDRDLDLEDLKDAHPSGKCAGYILGVVDLDITLGQVTGKKSNVCVQNVQGSQLVDVVKFYLRGHPEERHFPAASSVVIALAEKFPCN